jgi:hypothetical protein
MNGDTELIETPLDAGGSLSPAQAWDVIAQAPSVEQEQQSFESFNVPWDFWGMSNDSGFTETALPQSKLDFAQILAKAPAVGSYDQAGINPFASSSGGGFFKTVGDIFKGVAKFLGSSAGGGTMETSPANQYTKTTPTTASTVAATVKKNWLPILALAVVVIIGAVLIFRRKR